MTQITSKLSNEILNHQNKIKIIYDFLEKNDTWHDLCRKSVAKESFGDSKEFYPYEKITFTLLLYYKFDDKTLLYINNTFLKSMPLYKKMVIETGLINPPKEVCDDFKLKICIQSIFNTIARNKDIFEQLKQNYNKYCLANELNNSLTKNVLDTKKTKI